MKKIYKTIKRKIKFFFQRIIRGFSDDELWNLDITIANFILLRIRRFKEKTFSHPSDLSPEEWDEILDKIIKSMELIAGDWDARDEKIDEVNEGLDLFRKYFFDLWW